MDREVLCVADSRSTSLKSAPAKMAYVHYKDRPPFGSYFVVRGLQPADVLIASVREAIWKYAPDVTIARIKPMDSQVTDSLATERFQTWVVSSFGIAALLLAMLGIYGVLTYSVATRRQEIGVRMALGARGSDVLGLVVGQGLRFAAIGLAVGLVGAYAINRIMASFLFGVRPTDPVTFIVVPLLVLAVALVSSYVPAHRAAKVDPMTALRSQ